MRKPLLAILILILSSFSLRAQWEILNQGYNLWSMDFINESTGWIIGNEGKILKTTDGGSNWEIINTDSSWYIREIAFINDSLGWGFGNRDTFSIVIKTSDGGENWSILKEFSGVWFNSMLVSDESNICILAYNSILKSTNGGVSWIDISPGDPLNKTYNAVWFANPDTGIVTGNYYDGTKLLGLILKTTNGGEDWLETRTKLFNSISDLFFLNDSTGYFKASDDSTNFLCKTEDMFSSWKVQSNSKNWIGAYQFTNNSTGYAFIGYSFESTKLMKTTNSGVSWDSVPAPDISGRLIFQQMHFNETGSGIIEGSYGCLFKTDDGINWELVMNAYPFNGTAFFDKQKGFIYGGFYAGFHDMFASGDLFSTADGGKTYDVLFSAHDVFNSCEVISDSVVLLSGKSIYKTKNGGESWDIKYTARSDSAGISFGRDLNVINDLSFVNQNGWAVGRDWDSNTKSGRAIILNTTDTGENWKVIWQSKDSLNAFHYLQSIFINEFSGWAVGYPGLILQYTNKKGWITLPSNTDLPLVKVLSKDDKVWISGGYDYDQSIFLKSTNNGETWKKLENLQYNINDFVFIDTSLGWAVGQNKEFKGVILKSTNGGDSWEVNVDNLPGPLNSINVKDNYAWAVGQRGLIIKTTNAGVTWIDNNDIIYPAEYRLEQNYPNPFNPVTVITWKLPASSRVSLKVYDIIGKEVAVLVNEVQSAGVHKIEFNAGNLPSGIYFYKLESEKYSEVRKMVLLR